MARKFRLDSASAEEVIVLTESMTFNIGRIRPKAPLYRGVRLLLHWWAVGHDPKRALNRCEDCWEPGSGCMRIQFEHGWHTYDDIGECTACNGTGRADVEFGGWRKL